VTLLKEELKTPIPYCLHHKIELESSILETKHCAERACHHLVFVKEVWTTVCKNKETPITKKAIEVELA